MLALAVALAGVGWLAAPAIAAPVFSATLFEESGGVDPVWTTGAGDRFSIYGHSPRLTERLLGGRGNDRVVGASGSDCVYGGAGNDYVSGGGGADLLKGGSGRDVLAGSFGPDRLDCGPGATSRTSVAATARGAASASVAPAAGTEHQTESQRAAMTGRTRHARNVELHGSTRRHD